MGKLKEHIFIIDFNVVGSEETIMPDTLAGAIVSCYVKDIDFENAINRVIEKFENDGLIIKEIFEPVHTLTGTWNDYVAKNWEQYGHDLPNETEFHLDMDLGRVLYSPFVAYEASSS